MKLRIIVYLLILLLAKPVEAAQQQALYRFDHSTWDRFLKEFVNDKGEVDYKAVKKDSTLLNAYLEKLKSISGGEFKRWSREERIAILINAYNAWIIKLIVDHYPVKSVHDIPGVWDETAVQIETLPVLGKRRKEKPIYYSLNQIQSGFLRGAFKDEKILFALSSGAKGSPRLRQEAYVGPKLEGQLYLATKEFVNDEGKNQIVPGKKKIILSRLFKWYAYDFVLNWGNFLEDVKWNPKEMAVLSFLAHYLEDETKVEFLKEGKYKIKYHVFDWKLNQWEKP